MHADAHYAIGASHLVCQDYALAGELAGGAYAIVADGCSSAAGSDVGARLLGRAAERAIAADPECVSAAAIVERAARAAAALGIDPRCLDATLAWAVARGDRIAVTMTGDGVIAATRADGSIESWSVDFDRGAPAYLGYLLDEARMVDLLALGQARRVEHASGGAVAASAEPLASAPYLFELELDRREHPLVVLLSDGAKSFAADGGEPVALERVLAELCRFKTVARQFVARRMRRFLGRECPERGWRHKDDLAAAALAGGAP